MLFGIYIYLFLATLRGERDKIFFEKFLENLIEHGVKNFMQGIYLGYICTPDGEKQEI